MSRRSAQAAQPRSRRRHLQKKAILFALINRSLPMAVHSCPTHDCQMQYRRFHIPGSLVFLTLVSHHRKPILTQHHVRAAFRKAVQCVGSRHPFRIAAYVVLPDHCHMLWALPEGDGDLSTRVRLIKHHMSRQPLLPQPIWQSRFWDHIIRDEIDLHRHLDYVHYNPVKHGLTQHVADWADSSFSHFMRRGSYEASWGSEAPDDTGQFGE
jgi:putative transposase